MKKEPPGPRVMQRFVRVQGVFIILLVLAFIPWEAQDFLASFAATEMTTQTTLRTMDEQDDARVLRAFEQAQRSLRGDASLVTEPNPQQQTRDAVLTLTAKTKREVLDQRRKLIEAMQSAFAQEGPGELYDHGNAPYATPVPNAAMLTVKRVCRGLSLALLLAGLVMLLVQWKRSRVPRAALLGMLASGLTLAMVLLGDEGAGLWGMLLAAGLPAAFLTLVINVTLKVRRAATWQEGRARITQSKVEVERHRFAGDTTKVKNKASVAYDFTAGSQTIHGDRISIGFAPADNVDETLKRYATGAEVPVFYDPANPQDCVLERDPPASLGCIWTGTLILLLVYGAAVLWFGTGWSPGGALGKVFPKLHHPSVVISSGLLGLLCLASAIWNRRHQRRAFPWLRTKGTIVSSAVESYLESDSTMGSSRGRYYKPVIEFSYQVEGREYHNTIGGSDVVRVSVSGNQAGAEAEVARHPAGMEVEVFFDPKNPTRSGLHVDTEMMLTGSRSFVVAAVLFVVAVYAALH